MILIIFIAFMLYIFSIDVSVNLDAYCQKLDPHHDEDVKWLLIPYFNILIQLIFLLVIILHQEDE